MRNFPGLLNRVRGIFVGVLTSLLFLFCSDQVWSFGLMVQPSTIELRTTAASQHRQTIQVRNMRPDRTLTLTVGASDWTLDESGKLKLFSPSTQPRSAAQWLQFSPATLTLKPGETQQIIVDVAVPANVSLDGDHRVALLISTLLPQTRESGSAVWNRYQVASLFYVAVGNSNSEPVVERSWMELDESGTPVLKAEIKNSGNTHARLTGSIAFKSSDGQIVHSQPFQTVVLNHQTVTVQAQISDFEKLPTTDSLAVEVSLENTVSTSGANPRAVSIKSLPEPFRLDALIGQRVVPDSSETAFSEPD